MQVIPDVAVKNIENVVGKENLIRDKERLSIYSRGSIDREGHMPDIAVSVESASQVSGIMKIANQYSIPVVVRGGGSSPTGAVVPIEGGMVVDMKRMNSISVSVEDGYVAAEAGATLSDVDKECRKHGFFFPPDPSSVSVATVGGAINENSGGMRCARYGVMKDWLLKIEVVMPDGTETSFGEKTYKNRAGFNFTGLIAGSEGTLCIVTKAWLKIMPLPEKTLRIAGFFNTLEEAGDSIFNIRKNGLNPLILEYADAWGIKAANEVRGWHYPETPGGMVLVDMELIGDSTESQKKKVVDIFNASNAAEIMIPRDQLEIDNIFEVRRIAFAAPGRLFSGFIDGDIVVPISRIKEAILRVSEIRESFKVYIATCGHAGDGNLHPQIGANVENMEEWKRAKEASIAIDRLSIELGGSISGEHGIGIQKEELMVEQFEHQNQQQTMKLMIDVKKIFDPNNILNPGKFGLGGKD